MRKPWYQGQLDCLCGVYAVVNCFHLLAAKPLDAEEAARLFRGLCDRIGNRQEISDAIGYGLEDTYVERLLKFGRSSEAPVKIEFSRAFTHPAKDVDTFWAVLQGHIDLDEGRVAILSMHGEDDHWTVISKVTDKRIEFFDSSDFTIFNKSSCKIDREGNEEHFLAPTETFLISVA